jgi:hypothetical protein
VNITSASILLLLIGAALIYFDPLITTIILTVFGAVYILISRATKPIFTKNGALISTQTEKMVKEIMATESIEYGKTSVLNFLDENKELFLLRKELFEELITKRYLLLPRYRRSPDVIIYRKIICLLKSFEIPYQIIVVELNNQLTKQT